MAAVAALTRAGTARPPSAAARPLTAASTPRAGSLIRGVSRRLAPGRSQRKAARVARAAMDPMEEARQAAMSANELPEGVTSEDLRAFYHVVDSRSWEDVQEKAIELVQAGTLTQGVVLAGEAVLAEATRREEDPRILSSLTDTLGLLTSALEIVTAPPGLRLADECSNLILQAGSVDAAKPQVVEMLQAAFDNRELEVSADSMLDDVDGFLANIESQEEQYKYLMEKMKEEASAEEITQMIEFASQRETAKKNLVVLKEIINEMSALEQ
eukprot:jgi/Tetstr1/426951/TSEL_017164.t1